MTPLEQARRGNWWALVWIIVAVVFCFALILGVVSMQMHQFPWDWDKP